MKKNNPTQERQFTITLNQHQLLILERMTDYMSRIICGQLDSSLPPDGQWGYGKSLAEYI